MAPTGLVQMYWGDGKGKTTAAIGLGVRAVGNGLRVHLVQFVKSGTEKVDEPGELRSIEELDGFTYERFGAEGWAMEENTERHVAAAEEGLEAARNAASSGDHDLVIMDEVLYAVSMGLLDEDPVLEVVEGRHGETELVLTGSHERLPGIEEAADLVTRMKKVKHPFDEGVQAREGIEY